MPNEYFDMTVISRGRGSSAVASAAYDAGARLSSVVASAAYRSGETLRDERADKTFDYTRKEDVLHTEIMLPSGAPEWAGDRQRLWNAVEAVEKRKDAQLARSLIGALPRELTTEQNIAFVREFAREHFVSKGMIADIAVHDKDASDGGRNPHVHIMLTMREIGPDGFARKKNRDWNRRDWVTELRAAWETMQNRHLEAAGVDERVSLESYTERGINKEPQEHLGPQDWKAERNGKQTEKGERNREIAEANELREAQGDAVRDWLGSGPSEPEPYEEADIAAYDAMQDKATVALYEPDYDSLPPERETRRLTMVSRDTVSRWFGLGTRTTITRYRAERVMEVEGESGESTAATGGAADDTGGSGRLAAAWLSIARSNTVREAEQWMARTASEALQRAQEVKQQVAERVTSWRERMEEQQQETSMER